MVFIFFVSLAFVIGVSNILLLVLGVVGWAVGELLLVSVLVSPGEVCCLMSESEDMLLEVRSGDGDPFVVFVFFFVVFFGFNVNNFFENFFWRSH